MKVEEIVNDLTAYTIIDKYDLNIDYISNIHDIIIVYHDTIRAYLKFNKHDVIYIKKDTKDKMWSTFCLEFGHYILHHTNQLKMNKLYNEKQEFQAEKFSLLFRMPERLTVSNELWTVDKLVQYFNVSYSDAHARIELLMNRSKTHRLVGVKSI